MSPGMEAQQAFRFEPRNLTVRMGATAVLRCEVLRASGTVQWVKNGLLLGPQRSLPGFPRYSMIGNPKRGQYHLQIEKVQLEDDTFYECQAGPSETSKAIVSHTVRVTVLIPPSKPYFEADMATPWVAGKKYSIVCVAPDAKPEAEITLYKGESSLQLNHVVWRRPFIFVSGFLTVPPQPPVIVGLEREEVKAGRVLVLECVSHGGNPLATLHWTKNGEVLSTIWEEDSVALKSSSILRLKITPADNQAELCCESINLVSRSPLSVSRKITLLGSLTAAEGQNLSLSCHASSSNPPVLVRWWLGYKELNDTVGDNGGMTTISNMTHQVSREEDGLKLTCEAFNRATHFSKSQTGTLSVFYPPQKVWLEAPPQDVPLHSGNVVRLVCFSTGGNPTGTLTWFKVRLCYMHVSRELILVLTASDNMATYRCDATNETKKKISAYTKLMVHFTAISMKITAKQDVLRRGQMLTLDCYAGSSNPRASVSWRDEQAPRQAQFGGVSVHSSLALNLSSQYHNQKVICQAYSPVLSEGANTFFQLNVLCEYRVNFWFLPFLFSAFSCNEYLIFHLCVCVRLCARASVFVCFCEAGEQHDDHSLEIKNVTRKDAGVYTVKCANDEGVNQISIMLTVHYAPGVRAEKDPVFVNLGETADLICVADARPIIPDMFSWKWLETQEDESGLLTIHEVTRAHAGLYQCTADNGIGLAASVNMQLVVQCERPQWRKVASRGDGTTTAEVVCQAEGIPRVDFSWEKNGARMDFANPRYEEQTEREGSFHTSTVRVVNVSALLDYAVFSCTARNSLGEDKLDIQLVSTSHPDPPSSFRKLAVTHDAVTLEWVPGFNGGRQQRFRISGSVGLNSVVVDRYRGEESLSFMYVDVFPPGATIFTVTGLQPASSYNFSVNALNAIGESSYADNNAILSITTKGHSGLPASLAVVLAVVFGVLLLLNSLGCFFGLRWKKSRGQTGNHNYLFICGCEKVSSTAFCHCNALNPQQNSKEITLSHDAIVSSASHSPLISPYPTFYSSVLSPLLSLIL
uniref:NPHS1 adhesion molecule, nephrin n=1 Tax=Salarias fasciatus TaxID=181472 RepID=A0A672H2F9_SALFA